MDSNGEEVGLVLGFYPGETSLTDFAHFADRASILRTVDGVNFIFSIGFHEVTDEWTFEPRTDSDKQGGLGWVSNDCSGIPFKADVEGGFNDMRNDVILNDQVSGTSRYFVMDRTATPTTVATQSQIFAPTGGCSVNDSSTITNGLLYTELTPGPFRKRTIGAEAQWRMAGHRSAKRARHS